MLVCHRLLGWLGGEGKRGGKEEKGGVVPHTTGIGNKQLVLLIKCAAGKIVWAWKSVCMSILMRMVKFILQDHIEQVL